MPLPPDWRARWIELVTGRGGDASFLAGGPLLDAAGGLAVYQEAWRMRLVGALRVETPGLAALIGDRLDALGAAWFAAVRPHSWTLNHVADGFADWLEASGEPPEVVEMARLDHCVMRSFSAGELPPLRIIDGLPNLAMQPHAFVLRFTTDVFRYRTAVVLGVERPPIARQPGWLAIWRADRVVQTLEIDAATGSILAALGDGLPVAVALDRAFTEGFFLPETLGEQITEAFRLASQYGILGVPPEGDAR